MAIGIAWWSIFTSLTGAVLALPLMLIVRFFFGIGKVVSRQLHGR